MVNLTSIGHALAKPLGIKLYYRNEVNDDIRRGESVFSTATVEAYVEEEPRNVEWFEEITPNGRDLLQYLYSLFPFTHWITRYNLQWLAGDLVAGITIGAVVVPQGMAYAQLANLSVEYGLYTSFMGVVLYWFFATSKDITIGPVAVMSKLTGQIVAKAAVSDPDIPGPVVASCLAVVCGIIIVAIGLARCGWIVDLIPLVSIAAFMTGSALNIAAGQLPTLFGITITNSRGPTYGVVIRFLQGLPRTDLNAAVGITALVLLYLIRFTCNFFAKRWPARAKTFFFISTLRTAFVILLYTMVSWLVNRNHRSEPLFNILGEVSRGFTAAGVPQVSSSLIQLFADDLPAAVIVLLIEHIAISKSFGRINNYIINPSQEMVAIGITNIFGPFLGAYPATGSFSRTAIKSKAGVRTPFAGVITAAIVLLAIYALTAVFFYIPNAALAAVIIHAVMDLITSPNTVYQFWRVSPFEVPIFFAGVLVTIFSSIENGIYTTIALSFALMLFRILKARGRFLGKVRVHSVLDDQFIGGNHRSTQYQDGSPKSTTGLDDALSRNIFLPLDHRDGSNPDIDISDVYPGVFIYRFNEGFNYPNANHYLDQLTTYLFAKTRRTDPHSFSRLGDRPWNNPGPRRGHVEPNNSDRPTLKAVILDFSAVNHVDITCIQQLIDVRNQMDKYAAPSTVDWHFSNINSRWTKRALVAAGFGYPTVLVGDGSISRWKPIFSVTEIGGDSSAAAWAEQQANEKENGGATRRTRNFDISDGESGQSSADFKPAPKYSGKTTVVSGLNRPLFHIDNTGALQSAVENIRARDGYDAKPPAETLN
ncbi:putative sulfate permease 2 [Calycina marina]|uniref:Sulfate permease 2 n=1 Tax=Calycina marina TaxID=1763456 RepID=A0A9P7Z459_9HELO|nr:putative sulfate permease 2 [Calycina marina]